MIDEGISGPQGGLNGSLSGEQPSPRGTGAEAGPEPRGRLLWERTRDPLQVFPPTGEALAQVAALDVLLRQRGGQVALVVDGQAVPLEGGARDALSHIVEALAAGHVVTCVPHPVQNPVDLRKR